MTAGTDFLALRRRSVTAAVVVALGLVLAAFSLTHGLALAPAPFIAKTAGLYALSVAIMLRFLPLHLPQTAFGGANLITLLRAGLLSLAGGFVGAVGDSGWWPAGLATTALALDGLDGWIARRSGRESGFGARFDMEIDSLGTLILAALVWTMGQAGAWVFLAGLLRYGFVLAGLVVPRLAGDLPPSNRRKAACAAMVAALAFALLPPVPPFAAMAATGAALIFLIVSFTLDVFYLMRAAAPESRPAEVSVARNAGK